jgi:putative transcriptional regulator
MSDAHHPGDPAELAALYAAGSLAPDERAAFESHLAAGCAACRDEVDRLAPVVAALAGAVRPTAPGPQTRERLLARVAAPAHGGGATPLRRQLDRGGRLGEGMTIQRADEAAWEKTEVPGVSIRVLLVDREHNRFSALVRMEPGASYPRHVHGGPEECLVLEGELHVGDDVVMRPGDYQYAATGSKHGEQRTETGCLLMITSSLTDVFV